MLKQYKLKSANGYKMNVEVYNSANAVIEDCKKRSITSRSFQNMNDGNLGGNSSSFCGVESYDEALELLRDGYQPSVEKLKTELKNQFAGTGKRISFKNDIVGYAPVVPLAVMGVPESMINSHIKPIKAKVVDVYYDGTFSWTVKSEDIIKTGCKVVSVILQLEQQGYRFNLYQVQTYSDSSDADVMVVKLKDAAQPLDLKRVSFPLTHTAFFRVIGWDWYSKVPNGRYRSGYGHAAIHENRINNKLTEIYKEMFGENAVYISGNGLLNKGKDGEKYLEEVFTNAKSNNNK